MATAARSRRSLLRRIRGAKAPYTLMAIAGAVLVDLGVALVFVPAAVVLAGLAITGLGLVGLGMKETP